MKFKLKCRKSTKGRGYKERKKGVAVLKSVLLPNVYSFFRIGPRIMNICYMYFKEHVILE